MLEVKRSGSGLWARALVSCLLVGLAGCHADVLAPKLEDLMEPAKLKYESAGLTPQALEKRMKEVDDLYAEPRSFGKVYASYELCLASISAVNGFEALWRGARACAWIGQDPATSRSERERFALIGMSFGKEAIEKTSTKVESFYYLALSRSALVDLKRDATRTQLKEMREKMLMAKAIDRTYDHCGPLRFLGTLYVSTDPYPTYAVGTVDEGLKLLQRATEECSDFAENHLAYAKALLKDEQYAEARAQLEKVLVSRTPKDHAAEHDAWLREAQEMLTEVQGK